MNHIDRNDEGIVRLRTRLTGFCTDSNLRSINYTKINHDSFDHYNMRNSNRHFVFKSSYRIRDKSIPSLVRLKDVIVNENSSIHRTNSEYTEIRRYLLAYCHQSN